MAQPKSTHQGVYRRTWQMKIAAGRLVRYETTGMSFLKAVFPSRGVTREGRRFPCRLELAVDADGERGD